MELKLHILLPVYYEGENIERTLSEIERNLHHQHQIFVIYDFDEDNTVPVVNALAARKDNLKLVKNRLGRGVLNAIKTGFEH
jgi:dolichol-phosphate mannosyltransferase